MNKLNKRKCKVCSKEFTLKSKGRKQVFCSKKCTSKFARDINNPITKRKCLCCEIVFEVRTSNNKKIVCGSKKCIYERLKKINPERWSRYLKKQNEALHLKENKFSEKKYKYADKIIEYKNSPTGKAYIGLAKQPLMANKNGIGFQGVLLQSENRELVQCYECGNWYQALGSHIKKHKITIKGYRKKYGFKTRTSFVSDVLGNFLAAQVVNSTFKRIISTKKYAMARKKGLQKLNKSGRRKKMSRETENLYGTCPAQLKAEVVDYVKRFHRLPSGTSSAKRGGFSKYITLKNKFGSVNNAFKEFGLPIRHNHNPSLIEYIFLDKTSFYIKHGKGYEELYLIMKQKCPILSK